MNTRDRIPAFARTLSTAALLALVAPPLLAQSGEEVVRTTLDLNKERMKGIDNYLIVQEVMGRRSEAYFEREEVNGQVVFVPRDVGGGEVEGATRDLYSAFYEVAERATREGSADVDGHTCHVISITDFEGTQLEAMVPTAGDENWKSEKLTLYIGEDDYLAYRMTMEGTATVEGKTTPITFDMHMRDYRNVDGMVHPFLMEIATEGLTGTMTPEQQQQLQAALEQMKDMPPEQQEAMKNMMGDRFEQLEKMAATGSMEVTVQVIEIRVNEGPPQ